MVHTSGTVSEIRYQVVREKILSKEKLDAIIHIYMLFNIIHTISTIYMLRYILHAIHTIIYYILHAFQYYLYYYLLHITCFSILSILSIIYLYMLSNTIQKFLHVVRHVATYQVVFIAKLCTCKVHPCTHAI